MTDDRKKMNDLKRQIAALQHIAEVVRKLPGSATFRHLDARLRVELTDALWDLDRLDEKNWIGRRK